LAGVLVACTPSSAEPGTIGSGHPADTPSGSVSGPNRSTTASSAVTVPSLTSTTPAPAKTELRVTASDTAFQQGTPVTLRFALTGGDPISSAWVTVLHAGQTSGASLDSKGTGSIVLATLPGGRQKLEVRYAGDTTHTPASGSVIVTVAATSKIALQPSPAKIAPGAAVTLRYTVTASGKPVKAAATAVSYAGRTIHPARTDAQGRASIALADLPGGQNTITVRYAGDALHAPTSASVSTTVHAPSAISVSTSDTRASAGNPVTVGWSLMAAGRAVSKAPVVVKAGSKIISGRSGTDGKGSAVLDDLPLGTTTVTVSYAGDAGHGAISGGVNVSVSARTDVSVYASDTAVTPGSAVNVGFHVTSSVGSIRGGSVTVGYAGGSHIVSLDGNGRGSLTIPGGALSIGWHTVTVDYAGAALYRASSGSVGVSVTSNTNCPAWAKACVDLTHSVSWLQSNGKIIYGPVPISSGRPGYRTPSGSFQVYWKDRNHHSSLFGDASMPNSVFFVGGVAFHEGNVGIESHGCIHLSWSASQEYWDNLSYGDGVVVFGFAPY
jgi:hypothetical protein